MPHQCTNCGRTFPDGSKEMLSGCPDCGGNKFQFAPSSGATAAGTASELNAGAGGERTDAAEPPSGSGSESDAEGVASRAAETVRGWVSSDSTTESAGASTTDAESAPTASENLARTRKTEASASSSESRSGTEPATGDDGGSESDGFSEWPDSARRPEDRTSAAAQSEPEASDAEQSEPRRSVTTRSGAERSTAARSVPEDGSAGSEDAETNARPVETPESGTAVRAPTESEDSAQASARSEVVPTDDLPADAGPKDDPTPVTDVGGATDADAGGESEQPPNGGRVVSEPSGEQPSIEDLRAELNEQFESIKIVRPGQYELNLMELYNREEYIISLQEDGRYVIDVPDSWHDGGDE